MNHAIKSPAEKLIHTAIQRVAVGPDRGRDIDFFDAKQLMEAILDDHLDEVQVAVFLIALRMKRESLDECRGIFTAMQASVDTIEADVSELVCLADPFDGYVRHLPMSPFLPAVLAACGLPSLMHGVETVGPKHGITANKVYQLAGIDVSLPSKSAAARIAEFGWAYLDQSQYADKLFALNQLRDRVVKRTALTTLERLLMPIRARGKTHLVLGYVHKAYPQIYAAIANLAGYDSALLIKGVEGGLCPALNKPLRRYFFEDMQNQTLDFTNIEFVEQNKELLEIDAVTDANVAAHPLENDDAAAANCLELGLDVLQGKAGIASDSLSLAAGQIVFAHKKSGNLQSAVRRARTCLNNGEALARFKSA